MAMPGLSPSKPIPLKDRVSMIFLQYGQIDVIDGAFVLIDKTGIRTHIPVGSVACIMLEPGTRVSHAAVRLAAQVGTLLVWVGEAGVRVYASGQPGGARSDKLLYQAKLALDEDLRLKVVRKMFELRFGEPAPARRSGDRADQAWPGQAGADHDQLCQPALGRGLDENGRGGLHRQTF